jgi:DNA-directed RNA polymerase specialized sigma24 family protein
MRCPTDAWNAHETELLRSLRHRAKSEAEGDDLLLEAFLPACHASAERTLRHRQSARLAVSCRDLLINRLRLATDPVPLPEDLAAEVEPAPALAEPRRVEFFVAVDQALVPVEPFQFHARW